MDDFNITLQCDDFTTGDDFLLWVAHCEWVESQKDDDDRHWDDVRESIQDEWADNQPLPW